MTQATQLIYKDAFSDMSLAGWVYEGEGEAPELVSRNGQVFVHLIKDQVIKNRIPALPDTVYKLKAFVDKEVPVLRESIIVCKLTELDAAGNPLNQQLCYSQFLNLFYVYAALKTSSECKFIEIALTNIPSDTLSYNIYINDVNLFSVEMENTVILHEDFNDTIAFSYNWVMPEYPAFGFTGCLRRPVLDNVNDIMFSPYYDVHDFVTCASKNELPFAPGEVYRVAARIKLDRNFKYSAMVAKVNVLTTEGYSYGGGLNISTDTHAVGDDFVYYEGYFYFPEYEMTTKEFLIGGILAHMYDVTVYS
ncbi:hypothetical protein [Enterobacter sp. CP102]|uniref:hypothetical protein n=1 Tax=Enterobacter sp. CP102 TaxID=2976431 RepID=UPI0021F97410|nr:hypothetical protein [Enterobacter sp. CP102]UWM66333.1 hypothetical protein N1249_11105 [Enterobacter sp. CP102]